MAENRRHTEYYKDTRREEKKPITPTPTEFNPKRKKNNNYYNITEMVEQRRGRRRLCVGTEPTSVLDTRRSPSPPTSTSTLSSSCGGGGSDTAGVAAVSGNPSQKWPPAQPDTTSSNAGVELHPIPASVDLGAGEKCGLGMEDWESVLSETAASPGQEQSILRWIMGDVEDPSVGLNKLLQSGGGGPPDFEFSSGFGVVDQGFGFEPCLGSGSSMNAPCPGFPPTSNSVNSINHGRIGPVSNPNQPNFKIHNPQSNPNFAKSGNNLMPISFNQQQLQQQPFEALDEKPQILFPGAYKPAPGSTYSKPRFFLPLPYAQQEQNLLLPPQAKRHNTGPIGALNRIVRFQRFRFRIQGRSCLLGDSSSNSRHKGFLSSFSCFLIIFSQGRPWNLGGFDRIHIIDFDIGYGGQWASLMQELALRNGENEAVAVNLPVGSFSNYPLPLPLVLRVVKQLSPKIMVSLDRGCDRTDLPYSHHILHAFQSYLTLLESLDAVNVNSDALQKIERFLLQPGIEKIVLGRHRSPEKTPPWRTLLLSSGFSPLTFSNFSESQAECLVKRTPVRGFHVEKRQSSLVLCWQRKDLISASA
ncbi:hypothetical protein AAG906_009807 [Vitis piasezkii]